SSGNDDDDEGMNPGMSDPDRKTVECRLHGEEGPAYVCRHLNLEEPVGFVEGYDPDEPDVELFQAWCAACDEVLDREGEWNERSEWFAGIRLVCRACYRETRALNRTGG
ncbi:MAG TPA: hypothetical protein VLL48_01380, partial [Longimicrobiales bacterium]|nr:hypothetical protein [Longimicrobiales bacterium]